eukprot:1142893-Pelagomonas_calceolata.AAC.5
MGREISSLAPGQGHPLHLSRTLIYFTLPPWELGFSFCFVGQGVCCPCSPSFLLDSLLPLQCLPAARNSPFTESQGLIQQRHNSMTAVLLHAAPACNLNRSFFTGGHEFILVDSVRRRAWQAFNPSVLSPTCASFRCWAASLAMRGQPHWRRA